MDEYPKNTGMDWAKTIHRLYEAVDFLLLQTEITREALKTLGVTEEQLHEAEERVKAEYKRQAEKKNEDPHIT